MNKIWIRKMEGYTKKNRKRRKRMNNMKDKKFIQLSPLRAFLLKKQEKKLENNNIKVRIDGRLPAYYCGRLM